MNPFLKMLLSRGVIGSVIEGISNAVEKRRARKAGEKTKIDHPVVREPSCDNCAFRPGHRPPGYEMYCVDCQSLSKYKQGF